jgi:7,8-dihydropterin-6-yl-methyl-4-(beta-D-ribofuranosyl)aminobenzene 5'-phosphate synthase
MKRSTDSLSMRRIPARSEVAKATDQLKRWDGGFTSFEKGRTDHLCRASANGPWQPDPLLMDERMLVAHVCDLGLIVFSACSHAGIVKVCTEVRQLFPDIPIHCVMVALHLGGVMERIIPETVDGLRPFAIKHIIAGHCTGWRALHALADA